MVLVDNDFETPFVIMDVDNYESLLDSLDYGQDFVGDEDHPFDGFIFDIFVNTRNILELVKYFILFGSWFNTNISSHFAIDLDGELDCLR